MPLLDGLPPIENPGARALVLGSMPGGESLRQSRYYAHPQNQFWPLMERLVGASTTLPYAQRVDRLRHAGIALWDVIARCERQGSLDSAIRGAVANDFEAFFGGHPALRAVLFNGALAESTFLRQAPPSLVSPGVQLVRLPSTSPANRSLGLMEKAALWARALQDAGVELRPAAPV